MIWRALLWFRESLRHPDWIAAYALLIQVFIFFWQARILRRHATTLEENREIAGTQAVTADLIRQALQQQEAILKAQFVFQQRLFVQAERKTVFDLMVQLHSSVQALSTLLIGMPSTQDGLNKVSQAWNDMKKLEAVCSQTVITSPHITKEEDKCYLDYLSDVNRLKRSTSQVAELNQLTQLNDKNKDFLKLAILCNGSNESGVEDATQEKSHR